jgi:hypothetical protein
MDWLEKHHIVLDYPGYHNTIATTRGQYFWLGMKENVVEYINKCTECQKVKAKHEHLSRLLQTFHIPECKWEVASIDFIAKLPITIKQHDSIMVVEDKLTKDTHFIPMNLTHKETNIAGIYINEIA